MLWTAALSSPPRSPRLVDVAVLRDSAQPSGTGQFGAIQAVAPSLRVEVSPVNVRDAGEIERAVAAFARASNGGLILTGNGLANVHRELIIMLAARHKLPAVYIQRAFVAAGGLVSYGPDFVDQFRQAERRSGCGHANVSVDQTIEQASSGRTSANQTH